jgi:hypothetical protein
MSTAAEEDAVKYLLQIYENITRDEYAAMPEDEQRRLWGEWAAIREAPGVTVGVEMADPSTATTVRVRDGATLTTDGPFPETKEALGGYLLLEADDLDAAIAFAARIPTARMGGAIEVRPVVER